MLGKLSELSHKSEGPGQEFAKQALGFRLWALASGLPPFAQGHKQLGPRPWCLHLVCIGVDPDFETTS